VHELSIAQSICESVTAHAAGRRVEALVVEIGTLSGVNCDSLEFVFPEAAEMSGLAFDAFSIESTPARAACACGHAYEARELLEPCPACGGFERSITGGEDVVVSKLVVVENDEQTD